MQAEPPDSAVAIVALAVRIAGKKGALAAKLGIDHKTLSRLGGSTRLSTVSALAEHLDLPLEIVAERLLGCEAQDAPGVAGVAPPEDVDYDAARDAYFEAVSSGRSDDAQRAAEWMLARAGTDQVKRAESLSCASGAVEQQGLYERALEFIRRAQQCRGIGDGLRMRLEVNLASYLLELRQLSEARGIAREVQQWYSEHPPSNAQLYRRVNEALAWYVDGFATLYEIGVHAERATELAPRALAACVRARDLHRALARDFPENRWYSSIALSCTAAVLWARVEARELDAATALAELSAGLPVDLDAHDGSGQDLESYGRWCIAGAQIASAHATGAPQRHALALFLGKASDIAERTGNWSLWERVYTLELFRRSTLADYTTDACPDRVACLACVACVACVDWRLAPDEQDVLIGLMGRFPHFRQTAWRILDAARLSA